ncbi:MAG: hypothetical protein WKG00_08555 [Polyangiaceae bacterium]
MGFGIGGWVDPVGLIGGGSVGLSGEATYGTTAALRWWMSERVALMPALRLAISATDGDDATGTVAPSVSFGFAVYRGKMTRFVLSVGPSFAYVVRDQPTSEGPERVQALAFSVLGGMGLEHFFTSNISMVVGTESPLFHVSNVTTGARDETTVGAAFDATRFGAAVFFYTD